MNASLAILALLWIPMAQAQTDSFSLFCDKISAEKPRAATRPNDQMGQLFAVVDKVNNLDRRMTDALDKEMSYLDFKAQAAGQNIVLNDSFHAAKYARLAMEKCGRSTEAATATENSGAGGNDQVFYSELMWKNQVDDVNGRESVGSDGGSGATGTSEENGTNK